jgi:hypothetical protein
MFQWDAKLFLYVTLTPKTQLEKLDTFAMGISSQVV